MLAENQDNTAIGWDSSISVARNYRKTGIIVKPLDGNGIEKSLHQIKELRSLASGPLPGKSLVVFDPVFPLPFAGP
jgi:hypothetical protein